MNESDLAPAVEEGVLDSLVVEAGQDDETPLKLDAIWLAEYVTRLPTRREQITMR